MSEKIFYVTEEGTFKKFKLTMAYNSFTIEFIAQNKDYSREVYESGRMTLPEFRQKSRFFAGFDSVLRIADVLRDKLDSQQFVLSPGVLCIRFHNEYDSFEFVNFPLRPKDGFIPIPSPSPTEIAMNKIQAENDKLKMENANLKSAIQNMSQPVKVPPPAPVYIPPPKPVKPYVPPPPKPIKEKYFYKPSPWVAQVPIIGTYIPPSLKSGPLFERIEFCLRLKENLQKTCDDIYSRLLDVKKRIDNFVDKAFANNPSMADKQKALNLITELLLLRQGFKDMDDYAGIFKAELAQKGIYLSPPEKRRFDESMEKLEKFFPYTLTPFHQKIDHLFVQVEHNFFKEKNLRFYRPEELTYVLSLKDKLFNKL